MSGLPNTLVGPRVHRPLSSCSGGGGGGGAPKYDGWYALFILANNNLRTFSLSAHVSSEMSTFGFRRRSKLLPAVAASSSTFETERCDRSVEREKAM